MDQKIEADQRRLDEARRRVDDAQASMDRLLALPTPVGPDALLSASKTLIDSADLLIDALEEMQMNYH